MAGQRIHLGDHTHQAEWLLNTRAGQEILASFHATPEQRPRCACRPFGVPMYIGRRGSVLYLARMPGSGFLHTPDCPSHTEETYLSGAIFYSPGLISSSANDAVSVGSLSYERTSDGDGGQMHLDGLLDLLFEQASLNRWNTGEEGRTWQDVRERLQVTSQQIWIAGNLLSSGLFMPDKFNREFSDALHAEAESFIQADNGGLLCAPLREIQITPYGYRVVLKHLPYLKLWLSKAHAQDIEARYGRRVFHAPPRYALCLVGANEGRKVGNFNISNIAIRETDNQFVPCASEAEAIYSAALRADKREFIRPLRYDAPASAGLADFVVLNGEKYEPVLLDAETGHLGLDAARRSLGAMLARNKLSAPR